MKNINIVIPIYNEEKTLLLLKERLIKVINKLDNYKFNILLVNDGSDDISINIIKELRKQDDRISYLSLSRNFGKEIAVLAGLDYSKNADGVIIMDADLQDPPELIPKLISYWEQGYDDVYAKRQSRKGEKFLKKITSKTYYKLLQKMTTIPVQKDTGDYRMLDKRCVLAICNMREHTRCSKSIFNWIGYNKKEVLYVREPRIAGKTKWNYKKLFNLAIDGITSLSISPLNWSLSFSILLGIIGITYLIYKIFINLMYNQRIEIINLILFSVIMIGAIQIFLLGIMGEYLGRAFKNGQGRPIYLVDEYNGEKEKNNKEKK